jgi:hypothetical protein
MIFPILEIEDVVQTDDKTRLSATKTFVDKGGDDITKVQIKPDAALAFIDVTGNSSKDWFLDYQYDTDGDKTITLEVTTGTGMGAVVVTKDFTLPVILPSDDKLLSSDKDLVKKEADILNWVADGKSSFINIHRAARDQILDWLDSVRIWRDDGSRLTKDDISVTDDLRDLSTFLTLEQIFMGISNKVDDSFFIKARSYRSTANDLKGRGRIQATFDGSGDPDKKSGVDNKSMTAVRR